MALDVMVALSLLLNIVMMILYLTGNLAKSVQDFIAQQMRAVEQSQERLEKTIREEMARGRDQALQDAKMAREEMASHFARFGEQAQRQWQQKLGEYQNTFEAWREVVGQTLRHMGLSDKERFENFAKETHELLYSQNKQTMALMDEMSKQQKNLLDSFAKQLADLTQMNAIKLEHIREAVEQKLSALQQDNSAKLEQMRATVDEKLHQTLEQRLGESFKLVSERLEQVQKGLGEMQTLASGVGDLKRVLTNVKTRGTLGEIQLDNLLEQILSPDQYQAKAVVKSGSQERVDFAVKLPGKEDARDLVLLPIDAKFPLEDYQRLVEAEQAGDLALAQEAGKQLEARIKSEAKSIQDKYLNPPQTTDFAILFLPIEGLFAEVLRRPGLWEFLQREYRVIVTGPTTITALLNSLQMGFRTLAIQKRSSEVWTLLGAVKTEFGKFGDILDKTRRKLEEASKTIESASTRSRAIERKLRHVESIPVTEAAELLEELPVAD